MRVLIVDDEPLARGVIRHLLKRESDVTVVGACRDGREAARDIQALTPDVVFLDLQMPEMGGFDVVRTAQGGRSDPTKRSYDGGPHARTNTNGCAPLLRCGSARWLTHCR